MQANTAQLVQHDVDEGRGVGVAYRELPCGGDHGLDDVGIRVAPTGRLPADEGRHAAQQAQQLALVGSEVFPGQGSAPANPLQRTVGAVLKPEAHGLALEHGAAAGLAVGHLIESSAQLARQADAPGRRHVVNRSAHLSAAASCAS